MKPGSLGGSLEGLRDAPEPAPPEREDGEPLYRRLVETLPDALVLTDLDLNIRTANSRAAALLGYKSAQSLVGRNLGEFIAPEDRPRLEENTRASRKHGRLDSAEYAVVKTDGTAAPTEMTAAFMENGAGKPSAILAQIRDITHRKWSDQALRQREAHFRSLIDNAQDGIFVLNADGTICYASPATERIIGYKVEELVGQDAFQFCHPDYRPEALHIFRRAVENPAYTLALEFRLRHRDGTWRVLESVGKNLLGDPAVVGIVINFRDVTERKRAEELQAAVYSIAQASQHPGSLDDLYHSIHEIIGRVMPARNFYISLYDEQQDLISFPYFVDEVDSHMVPHRAGKGLTEYVLRTGKSLLSEPALEDELRRRGEVEPLGAPSLIWLGVPLVVGHKTIGVMAVQHYSDPAAYGAREQHMLEFVSSQVAQAIELKSAARDNSKLFAEIQRRANQSGALYELACELALRQSLPEVLAAIVNRAMSLLSPTTVAISLYEPERGELELVSAQGSPLPLGTRAKVGCGLTGYVAQTRQPLRVADYAHWEHRAEQLGELEVTAEMAAPMVHGGGLIGVMLVAQANGARAFDEGDMHLLTLLASQAASAVHNARLLQETRTRAEQLALVYDAGLALNSVLEPRPQLEFLFQIALKALHADRAEFFRYDAARGRVQLELGVGYSAVGLHEAKASLSFSIEAEKGIVPEVARRRIPSNVTDVSADPRWIAIDPEIRSGLWMPVERENQLLGVLGVLSTHTQAFTADDERLLMLFAHQAAVALENSRLFEQTHRRAEKLAMLNRIANASSQLESLDDLLELIYREITANLCADACLIALYDDSTQELNFRIRVDEGVREPPERRQLSTGLTGYVIRNRQTLLIRDWEEEKAKYPEPKVWGTQKMARSLLNVPMQVGATVVGLISLQAYHPGAFGEEEERLLQTIADQAAVAVEKARLFGEMHRRLSELEAAPAEASSPRRS